MTINESHLPFELLDVVRYKTNWIWIKRAEFTKLSHILFALFARQVLFVPPNCMMESRAAWLKIHGKVLENS